jgi:hypothetical protein
MIEGLVPHELATSIVEAMVEEMSAHPIRTAEGFRNAVLDGMIAINPMLELDNDERKIKFMMQAIREAVREGRMIDFGYIPNELIKATSLRTRSAFEAGELPHPYDHWLGVSSWEGGMCGYVFTCGKSEREVLCMELYGIAVPGLPPSVLINDVVSIETVDTDGGCDTLITGAMLVDNMLSSHEAVQKRGANLLDPLVTFLRMLSDASVAIVDVPAPERLNRQRVKRGKTPIPAHTRVLTRDYVAKFHPSRTSHGDDGQGGHHASPIPHWRRSHMRHLSGERVVQVRSSRVNWRGSEELHRLFYRVKQEPSHV